MTHAPNPWPTRSVGPVFPTAPIREPLLRIIPGDPRIGSTPIGWLNGKDELNSPSPLRLGASFENANSEVIIPSPDGLSSWFDFSLPCHPGTDAHITFAVCSADQPSTKYFSIVMLSEFVLSEETISRPLFDKNYKPVAILRLRFLRITPHDRSQHIKRDKKSYAFAPRFTGHRGMGSSTPAAPWRVLENTPESFLLAACTDPSVKTVELDVQMTSDDRTVIYHDWFFYPRDTVTGQLAKDGQALRTPIHNLSFEQFDSLYRLSYNKSKGDTSKLSELARKIAEDKILPREMFTVRARSLFDVCESMPEDVHFLIEVKYPSPDMQETLNLTCPEKNKFLDIMLDDLFRASKTTKRQAALLCFDPDVCVMLSLKQRAFPVYFSNAELFSTPCDHVDSRRIDFSIGFDFAKAQCLDGLMLFCGLVELYPDTISNIVQANIPILTYGKRNCDAGFVQKQFNAGVHGVVADDVLRLVKDLQTVEQLPPSGSGDL